MGGGRLGSLTQHLNVQVDLQEGINRLSGCQLEKFACKFCGDDIQQKDLLEYEGDKCTVQP